MKITVRTLAGQTHELTVEPHSTVRSVKRMIEERISIPIKHQRLVLVEGQDQKKPLDEDHQRITLLGVEEGSELLVVLKLKKEAAPAEDRTTAAGSVSLTLVAACKHNHRVAASRGEDRQHVHCHPRLR